MEVLKDNHEFFVALYIFVTLLISISHMERGTGLYPKLAFLHNKEKTGRVIHYLIIFTITPFLLLLKLLTPIKKVLLAFYKDWIK